MNDQWRANLRKRLEREPGGMKGVSQRAGLGDSGIQEMLGTPGKKPKEPKLSTVIKLLAYFDKPFEDLFGPDRPRAHTIKTVAVVGETAAGVWLEPDAWDEEKYPQVPFVPTRYGELDQRAYRVIGPSMNKSGIADGSFVITVNYADVRPQPQDGDVVVVERRRDGGLIERTIKEVVVRPDRFELTPRSTDDRFQEPFIIPRDGSGSDASDRLEIEIIALVIGVYRPI